MSLGWRAFGVRGCAGAERGMETHDTQFVLRSLAVQNLSCEVLRYKIRPARLAVQILYCEVLRN